MTQPLTFVVLSTDLDNFKAIRSALTAEAGAQLLAGGNDADQLYEEIVRLKPSAAIIALSEKSDAALRFIERLASECPSVALISAAHNNSPDVILQSLRAGAREFLRLPISADELRTVPRRYLAQQAAGVVVIEVIVVAGDLIHRLVRPQMLAAIIQKRVLLEKDIEPLADAIGIDLLGMPEP